MKTTFLKLILSLVVVALVSTSCKKDDDESTQTPDSNSSSTTATYVVKLKKDNNAEITYTEGSAMVLADKLIIGANNDDSDMQFSINPDVATGTYTNGDGYLISHGVNGVAVFTATNTQSSTLKITKHDKTARHIVGEFTVNYTDNNDNQISHTATGSLDVTYK